ncbi:MAG: hypothetical protein JXA30_18400 [Deltaproteobacteria bacterium]|nr:hypothetical protein [Deltaproteobacteria bacterium]
MTGDTKEIDKNSENEDLEAFESLPSPDAQATDSSFESDTPKMDLGLLASSSKNGLPVHSALLPSEEDSKLDLRQAPAFGAEEIDPKRPPQSDRIDEPPAGSEQRSSQIDKADFDQASTTGYKEQIRAGGKKSHWVLMILVGFVLGLSAATVAVFIFVRTERARSKSPPSLSQQQAVHNQRASDPSRGGRKAELMIAQARPSSAPPVTDETPRSESRRFSSRRRLPSRSERAAKRAIATGNSSEKSASGTDSSPLVAKEVISPILTSDERKTESQAKKINRVDKPEAATTTPSSQAVSASEAKLDRIIDGVLDATENNHRRESVHPTDSAGGDSKAAEQTPLAPTREQVTETMSVLLPAIRGCAGGLSGLATADIIVLNDGKVANVTVSGAPFEGTAAGRCIEGVVRKARFPRFRQPSFRIRFPFSIRGL